ncbi:flagellar basal body P-ring biosynthesis protein FlgA [Microvirga vignae]|uniref:Flagellar basal body P-ring biosynthesis protein FlgA n=1 Tax=Microvirga vignae TaxID=1225564 RepID=A0A0H1RBG1_9HYPH|nr:flagellar basal body P-ring biosynthesis protein FlgA [Microvirga vignae]KLK92369.1 flagellar basal body P-ring biosynthesis protein FlgA [Microvirga vignae]
MNYHTYYSKADQPVETCVVGTGGFGQSFLAQAQRVPLMNARIAVDLTAESAASGLKAAGIEPRNVQICTSQSDAKAAWDRGDYIAAGDLAVVVELPIDVVVEATGQPIAAARHALIAIEAGKHLALVTKELDSVVGPGLKALAADQSKIVTTVDGDQPSLLIGLATWAEVMGFDIVAAGKSSEYDFVFDPTLCQVSSNGRVAGDINLTPYWELGTRAVDDILSARHAALAAFPQRAVPDLCELLVVANATGLQPDRMDLHAPLARTNEVPTIFSERRSGGILTGARRLDVFHCLRRPDEISFAGGVFVVIRCEDARSWDMLAQKGHIVSRTGETAMAYLPRHLLGLEAATSILDATIHRVSGYGDDYQPRYELIAVATEDLPAGTLLTMGGHHHTISGVTAEFRPAGPLTSEAPAPFYLAADCRLATSIRKGEEIRVGQLELPGDSPLLSLRRIQDARFFRR